MFELNTLNPFHYLIQGKEDTSVSHLLPIADSGINKPIDPPPSIGDFYRKIVFVGKCPPGEKLGGDERLVIDLSEKLANGFNIPTTYVTHSLIRKNLEWANRQNNLYITINCNSYLIDENKRFSIAINNDLGNSPKNAHAYFEPLFIKFSQKNIKAITYPIETLPSRVTPEKIAEAAQKNPLTTKGRPVIAIMFREPAHDDIEKMAEIAQHLSKKHQAIFLVSTSPQTRRSKEEAIHEKFQQIRDYIPFYWAKEDGNNKNPYLWMLGTATHLVTSGTVSTTSDLLATGKPVYYADTNLSMNSADLELKDALIKRGAVGRFDVNMLDNPPLKSVRKYYAETWDEIGRKFAADLLDILADRLPVLPSNPIEIPHNKRMKGFWRLATRPYLVHPF